MAALLMREGGFLDRRVTKIAPERIPKLLKRARVRAERMPESSRKKWVLAKLDEWQEMDPNEVLKQIITVLVVLFLLGIVTMGIGHIFVRAAG